MSIECLVQEPVGSGHSDALKRQEACTIEGLFGVSPSKSQCSVMSLQSKTQVDWVNDTRDFVELSLFYGPHSKAFVVAMVRVSVLWADIERLVEDVYGLGCMVIKILHPSEHFYADVRGRSRLLRHDGDSNKGVSKHVDFDCGLSISTTVYFIVVVRPEDLKPDFEDILDRLTVTIPWSRIGNLACRQQSNRANGCAQNIRSCSVDVCGFIILVINEVAINPPFDFAGLSKASNVCCAH